MGLVNLTFYSRVLGMQTNVAVVLPTTAFGRSKPYDEMLDNNRKFKTLYVLHGGSDDCTYYYRNTNIERYANEGGFAAVMPEVQLSFYCDMAHGQKYFAYLSEELPAFVEAMFPLSARKEDRFVTGNSMGSHGTFKWALRRPDFFAAAAGMSGVSGVPELGFFGPDSPRLPGRMSDMLNNAFGSYEQYMDSGNDLKYLAKRLVDSGEEMPRLFSCCGTEDFTYSGCVDFRDYAAGIGLPLTFEEGPGGHTWEFWDQWLLRIIDWMGLDERKSRQNGNGNGGIAR